MVTAVPACNKILARAMGTLHHRLLLLVFSGLSAATTPSAAVIFSAGFTNYTILASAPASSAVYGFAYTTGRAPPSLTVTLTRADGSVAASVPGAPASAGAGTDCDGACYAAGYLSGVGTSSCCQATTCTQGCAIGGVVPSLAACVAQCKNASGCDYHVPGTTLDLDRCEGCIDGCPAQGSCEAGCGFRFGSGGASAQAWKALLPPQPAGGDYTITVACSNCVVGAAPAATLQHVAFGSVIYCSGQSEFPGVSPSPFAGLLTTPLTTHTPT
jgi:hypothetical protein